jgi:hypothetical protein
MIVFAYKMMIPLDHYHFSQPIDKKKSFEAYFHPFEIPFLFLPACCLQIKYSKAHRGKANKPTNHRHARLAAASSLHVHNN